MRLLLDTNAVIWVLDDNPRLGPTADVLRDPANDVWFSAVSVAEISLKASLGKLAIDDDYVAALIASGFDELPFTAAHGEALKVLPWHHRDPFDRMLIAQATAETLTVVTADRQFAAYDAELVVL
jgi:PIN domain nuclease of toxin-antitoxin system